MPLWEEVGKKMKGSAIRIGKIDADAETELSEKFEIQGFPTFKIIDGTTQTDYKGEHKVDAFVKFATEYKPRSERARRLSVPSFDASSLTKSIRAALEAFANESLLLYTGVVWGVGFFVGMLSGVLFALREKAKFDE
eukprot:CAMPEP_0113693082 /NCGR_PEP_ID=MMETSP0038_2-20120614/19465_1 /TAXON_ID=2898 /ORGANISM="Cryptomonas paramecium" /LENGTH=136 /DNA_ID=CAMNT_0000615111 /DNA_START=162 /DNA_END=570 /DNA_ORIENTATION=+ /assembly_acc=CAM_ASM_000170